MIHDLTAFVLVGLDADGYWNVHPYFWTPAKGLAEKSRKDRVPYDVWVSQGLLRALPGASISYAMVAAEIAGITDGLNVEAIAYDRQKMIFMIPEFQKFGVTVPLVEHGQGFKADQMPFALDVTEAAFLNGKVRHGMNPVLTSAAASCVVVKDPAGSRKLDKQKSVSRIDGMVSLAMALGIANKTAEAPKPREYMALFL